MSDEADDLLRLLRARVDEGSVRLVVDHKRLRHIDSPVGVEADSNIWIYGAVGAACLALWQLGGAAALAVAVLGLGLYATAGRRYVHRRAEGRLRDKALLDVALWRRLWRFGGVTLVRGEESCAAPDGNWMAFVRRP